LLFLQISWICETSKRHVNIGQTNIFHSRPIFTNIVRVLSGVGFQMFSQWCAHTGPRIFRVEYRGPNRSDPFLRCFQVLTFFFPSVPVL
jgi:hypothetical protein